MSSTITGLKSSRTLKIIRTLNSIHTIIRSHRTEFQFTSLIHHIPTHIGSHLMRTLYLSSNHWTHHIFIILYLFPCLWLVEHTILSMRTLISHSKWSTLITHMIWSDDRSRVSEITRSILNGYLSMNWGSSKITLMRSRCSHIMHRSLEMFHH